jgi:2-polyprenyl-3-methyl-5-hydroxy-6-metoxy-1,4-benzoquinol methylase
MTMQRIPEPELMDSEPQVEAYANADFAEPHQQFIDQFSERFGNDAPTGWVLDLGCGAGDITVRFAHAFPGCRLQGVDAGPNMLRYARAAVERAGLAERIELQQAKLPACELPRSRYDAIISNSLLHHLADPLALWRVVKRYARPDSPIFVMDLRRPDSLEAAVRLVEIHAAGEPEVLRKDFYHSLLAAYRPDEVVQQLETAGIRGLAVDLPSDRHLIVHGYLRPDTLASSTRSTH